MKSYYRVMLGAGSIYAEECYNGNFIGVDFLISINLDGKLYENWKDFNREFIPIWQGFHPGRSKIAAGLSCGFLWTVAKGIQVGDIVLCPAGNLKYYVGEVQDEYSYHPEGILPHRRTVKWSQELIDRDAMSLPMQNSICSMGTVCNLTRYADEIETLLGGKVPNPNPGPGETFQGEDLAVFALEKHLEDFLVTNWSSTEIGQNYDIYKEDGNFGQQFPSDTGPIDILAVSKDKKSLLVVELKKGKASDVVVGQIQRYMGYVKEELADINQEVKGVIIALDDDLRIKRALSVATNIEFYRYQISFKLFKG